MTSQLKNILSEMDAKERSCLFKALLNEQAPLKVKDAAAYLGISVPTFRKLISKIKHIRYTDGGDILFHRIDLDNFKKTRTTKKRRVQKHNSDTEGSNG